MARLSINSEKYYKEMAEANGGKLISFEMDWDREWRKIKVEMGGRTISIKHDWAYDGSSTKPWTYINGDDRYGRIAIWNDSMFGPKDYGEDIISMAH